MPLTIPDQTIASQVQVPNGMSTIGSMLDMQGKALQLRKNTATFDADVAQRNAESSSAVSGATVNAANVQPLIDQQAAGTKRTQTALASDQFKLSGEYLDKANQISQGLISDPSVQSGDINAILPKLQAAKQRMIDAGVPAATAEVQAAHLITAAVANPSGLAQLLKNSILQSQPSTQQSATIQPSVLQTDNGQQITSNNVNPFAQGGAGSQVIPQVQKQLPPSTQTFDSGTNTPLFLGPQSNEAGNGLDISKLSPAQIQRLAQQDPQAFAAGVQHFQQSQQPRVQAGPALGAETNAAGTSAVVNKDWEGTVSAASNAAKDIGVLQNIKQYAPGAATGITGAREALVSGLAGRLGMSTAELTKTNTDLLAKNSNMLALAGGDTNLAKTLAEAANPNTKMTPEAIVHAADQVIAQRQMDINKQKFLMPFKSNPDLYNANLSHFNSIADPRVLQFPNMSMQEKTAMKSAMNTAEQKAFGEKIQANRDLGFIP